MFRRAVSTIEGCVGQVPSVACNADHREQRERLAGLMSVTTERRSCTPFEADALFSYLPPLNIVALVMFLPLSYIL